MMTEYIQVSTTTDTEKNMMKIAEMLLAERLASCVQVIGPIKSSYWWNGRIKRTREWTCFTKSKASDYHRIESAIKKMHNYEVPEIIAVPIWRGNEDYLSWVRRETSRRSKKRTERDT